MIHVNWQHFFDDGRQNSVDHLPSTVTEIVTSVLNDSVGEAVPKEIDKIVENAPANLPATSSMPERGAKSDRFVDVPPAWHGTVVLGRHRWRGWLMRVNGVWVAAFGAQDDVHLLWLAHAPIRER